MAEAVRQSRGRNWCGTLNNPGGDVKVEAVLRACADVRYACGQREVEASTELSTTSFTLSSPRHIRFQLCEGCFLELIGRYAEEQSERPGTTVEKKRRVCPTLNGKSECGSITEEGGKELEKTLRLSSDD